MPELKTQRPYQERFLDNFDRSQLRREVQAVRPRKKFQGLRKKYATWALGASLALGGIGAPLKMIQQGTGGTAGNNGQSTAAAAAPANTSPLDKALAGDISA